MKRTSPLRNHAVRSSDPFTNLTTQQLAYIGAIALLYNDDEALVDEMCAAALAIPIRQEELLSRINGIEGKYQLIKLGAEFWGFTDADRHHLGGLLGDGGFHGLKKWRDAVIHARFLDIKSSTGRVFEKQGRISEVLLSKDALVGLYNRLDYMRIELGRLLDILHRQIQITKGDLTPPHKERLEQENRDAWAQARELQSHRQSLPPMPEFPDDTFDFQQMKEVMDRVSRAGVGHS